MLFAPDFGKGVGCILRCLIFNQSVEYEAQRFQLGATRGRSRSDTKFDLMRCNCFYAQDLVGAGCILL
jgi:hypothetical protein